MRVAIFAILCASIATLCGVVGEDMGRKKGVDDSAQSAPELLSRHKRYLIFPEGSSLQLVYCLTMPVIGRSTIFTIGGTAALAWELPHDPFEPYRKRAELLHRKDPPGAYTVRDPAQQSRPGKVPQSPSPSIKPPPTHQPFEALAAAPIRYVDFRSPMATINYSPAYNRFRYQNYQLRRHQQQQFTGWQRPAPVYYRYTQPKLPIKSSRLTSVNNVDVSGGGESGSGYHASPAASTSGSRASIYHRVHRRTRRQLYGKIEKFLSTQSKDGKACLLRAICEVHQRTGEKGSFMEEIMKAVLRSKPTEECENVDVYDHATNVTPEHNCTELYPSCGYSILNYI